MKDSVQHQSLEIDVAGEAMIALSGRALYWPRERMLMIADLHLGKSDTFRAFGIAVPQAVQRHDLMRLNHLLQEVQPRSLVVLGDFVHGRIVGDDTRLAWSHFRNAHRDVDLILTRGNHDRSINAADWQLDQVVSFVQVGPVLLSHEPKFPVALAPEHFLNVHGHVHPIFKAPGWRRALPALVQEGTQLVLPAFSAFTAGMTCHSSSSRVWVFAEDPGLIARVQ
ncbi:ligase-associated DNA damage response endonuclease PdeM [Ottowia thiooxydans]|uniref:DNA ligase-associated metallophosphoesterase n=1 Tax=Ottowia thiooxydans TaxID=219182 RepID=A0ABV2Q3D2_9BURK